MTQKAEAKRIKKRIAGALGKSLEGAEAFVMLAISPAGEVSINTNLKPDMAIMVMQRAITIAKEEKERLEAEKPKKIVVASR